MPLIRTERTVVLWAKESIFGQVSGGPYKRFGIHDTAVLPDPEFAWEPFYGVFSGRDRATILRGRSTHRGSIPDIRLMADNLDFVKEILLKPLSPAFDETTVPFTVMAVYHSTDGTQQLLRNFVGGKVNRATLFANEGQELRLSIEEMLFLQTLNARGGDAETGVGAIADPGVDPNVGASAAGRFLFAGA